MDSGGDLAAFCTVRPCKDVRGASALSQLLAYRTALAWSSTDFYSSHAPLQRNLAH